GPALWRGTLRLGQTARRRDGSSREDPRLLRRADRALQDPAPCQIRRRVPNDSDRQDPEIRNARRDDPGPEPDPRKDRVSVIAGRSDPMPEVEVRGSLPQIVRNDHNLYDGNLVHYLQVIFSHAINLNNPYHNFRHMFHVLWLCHEACGFYAD